MIKYVKRKDLDTSKYDNCIENSIQSKIYAFSWYLDIVVDNWDALVLEDYKAVMPITFRKKFFIKYVYPPFWVLELGVYSLNKKLGVQPFFKILFEKFRFVETRLNSSNFSKKNEKYLLEKEIQTLDLKEGYISVFNNYRKDRKKDLVKANKLDLIEKWNDSPEKLIELFKNNIGKRTPNIKEEDYIILKKLITVCIKKRVGEILSIYDSNNILVASGFFLKNNNEVTILVSSTDFKNRKNGANTFLIDRAVYKYEKNFNTFNFGGSSIKSVAKYFLSFGANTLNYQQVKYNKLPFLLKLFKK